MRGVVFLGERKAEIRDFSDPTPSSGEVVVQLKAGGLCGSDLHSYRQGEDERRDNFTIPGHEACGIVYSVGQGVTNVNPGDRVSVYHYRGCGYCRQCQAGNLMFCPDRKGYGGPIHGSSADFILTDARNCLPLPDHFSFAVGTMMACNAGTAFASINKLAPSGKDTIVILGQGPVGLAGTLFAKAMGARVIAVEPISARRELALACGADHVIDPVVGEVSSAIRELTSGDGASCSYETSGNFSAQNDAIECLAVNGTAVFVGFGNRDKSLNPAQFIGRQLTLSGSFVLPVYLYYDMVRFIDEHRLDLDQIVTHQYPLDQAVEAYSVFDSGVTGKVILKW
jgi:threonine dehydrogenase-like Zn-dependent dehydrogenase